MLSPRVKPPRSLKDIRCCHPMLLTNPEVRLILSGAKVELRIPMREAPLSIRAGDLLWVQEQVHLQREVRRGWLKVCYLADGQELEIEWPRHRAVPARGIRDAPFMVEGLSRLTLRLTSVRSERLQSISAEAALGEGLAMRDGRWMAPSRSAELHDTHRDAFAAWWEDRNRGVATRWAANPEVAVLGFSPIRANVASLMAGRGTGGAW